ncbi:unnamed protein product [Merluccius merluccius]
MSFNETTCLHGNHTEGCAQGSHHHHLVGGLCAGLVVLFLLVCVPAAVVYVKRARRRMSVWQLDVAAAHGKEKEEGCAQAEQCAALRRAGSHQYTSMGAAPCAAGQSAIYENYSSQQPRQLYGNSMAGHEEDLYLQCDSADDAIYNNDPACSLAMLPDPHQEDDVYIMPDSP